MDANRNSQIDFLQDISFDEILTNPILDIAARVWDEDRYEAFRICYRSMRRIDDLVDDRKSTGAELSAGETATYVRMLRDWLQMARSGDSDSPYMEKFQEVRRRFAIPFWPWERLGQAMEYDLSHNGFESFLVFLRYTEGAAIAPASIFTHLCGVRQDDSRCQPPSYDIRKAARHLAIFSYLVHIIRDFQKDTLANLVYFPLDLLSRFNLSSDDLRAVAEQGVVPDRFRDLISLYRQMADRYRVRAREMINREFSVNLPRYRLSLEIIYSLYSQIFERISPADGRFDADELNPTPEQVRSRIQQTIDGFRP